jgi:selenide,water dikinase
VKARRSLVLVGGGHAHVEVLRRWAARPLPSVRVVLVLDRNPALYSGMVPGVVAGQYDRDDLAIDAVALAQRAGAEVVNEPAIRVDADRRRIVTQSGEAIEYDIASLNVGSTVGRDRPGVSQHVLTTRPIEALLRGIDALIASAPQTCAVVGAGAAGVELAFCLEARLRRTSGRAPRLTLIDSSERLLPGAPTALRRRVARAAARRCIAFRGGAPVTAVDERAVRLADGAAIEVDAVIWAPGPAAPPLLRASGLPVDERAFVRITPTFQVERHATLFAAGDCAALPGMRRAGVYAVRSGPLLEANLRAALVGGGLRPYRPQPEFLSLLNLGDGSAIGSKRGIAFEGRWVMRLKDRIDRRFVARYR